MAAKQGVVHHRRQGPPRRTLEDGDSRLGQDGGFGDRERQGRGRTAPGRRLDGRHACDRAWRALADLDAQRRASGLGEARHDAAQLLDRVLGLAAARGPGHRTDQGRRRRWHGRGAFDGPQRRGGSERRTAVGPELLGDARVAAAVPQQVVGRRRRRWRQQQWRHRRGGAWRRWRHEGWRLEGLARLGGAFALRLRAFIILEGCENGRRAHGVVSAR